MAGYSSEAAAQALDGLGSLLIIARSAREGLDAVGVARDGEPEHEYGDARARLVGEALRRLAFEAELRRGRAVRGSLVVGAALALEVEDALCAFHGVRGAVLRPGTLVGVREITAMRGRDCYGERDYAGSAGFRDRLAMRLADGGGRLIAVRTWDGAEFRLVPSALTLDPEALAAARPLSALPAEEVGERAWAEIVERSKSP